MHSEGELGVLLTCATNLTWATRRANQLGTYALVGNVPNDFYGATHKIVKRKKLNVRPPHCS
jgi:hypothetical protein